MVIYAKVVSAGTVELTVSRVDSAHVCAVPFIPLSVFWAFSSPLIVPVPVVELATLKVVAVGTSKMVNVPLYAVVVVIPVTTTELPALKP